jgi:succinate dehydrogenase flavin-adding protein (antitoxin of CptAB toxin-antitoxin module)
MLSGLDFINLIFYIGLNKFLGLSFQMSDLQQRIELKKIKFLMGRGLRELNLIFEGLNPYLETLTLEEVKNLTLLLQQEDVDLYQWLFNLDDCPIMYQSLISKIRSLCITKFLRKD